MKYKLPYRDFRCPHFKRRRRGTTTAAATGHAKWFFFSKAVFNFIKDILFLIYYEWFFTFFLIVGPRTFLLFSTKKVLGPFSIFSPKRSSVVFDQLRWNKSSNAENETNNTIKGNSFLFFFLLCILHINLNFKREEDQKENNWLKKQMIST